MSLKPRFASVALIGLAVVLALAPGCSSRKKVSSAAQIEPPPTESTPPAPPSEEKAPPPPTETSNDRLSMEDAFFDFDDFSLRQDAKSALETDGKYLEKNSGAKVVIEGHCDERGSVEYNLALGEKRAHAAKDYLVSYGIPATRLTTISYGKERPFDNGHDEGAWAKNRRAHVVSK
ncbi:MAG TPA: peptidoglycan-associated lipoprotein Pal [Candidatus Binatia bacterium]|nr:peptidoglycan-associated lipoprotein Pal [Candidatus Binatia bacterium]